MKRNLQDNFLLNTSILNESIKEKLLFNPNIKEENIEIIGGNTTNLLVLEDTKFEWAVHLYDQMVAVRWDKRDVKMTNEPESYNKLTLNEKEAYDGTLCFLAFLDSLQVNNLAGNVSSYITAPEVVMCFAEQTAIEAQHSYIYQHIFQSLKLNRQEILNIYYKWEQIPILKKRNEYIASIYQNFNDNPTYLNYIKALIADLLLEGLYFYNGFAFFYLLASRGLTLGTAGNIRLINKDELFHTVLFQRTLSEIIKISNKEVREIIFKEMFNQLEIAIQQEIEWAELMYGNGKILGISNKSISDYTYHLAFKNIIRPLLNESIILDLSDEIKDLYNKYEKVPNPYSHIDKIANLDGGGTKGGFFETNNTDYMTVSIFTDFDEF